MEAPNLSSRHASRAVEPLQQGRRLRPAVIAIDGPAASGKSTVGFAVAERLGYLYFDTGILYRAITLAALEAGVDVQDEPRVSQLAETAEIDLRALQPSEEDGRQCTVLLDGRDVTWLIRATEVDRGVSPVSSFRGVRTALLYQQRRIARRYATGRADKAGIVMVGRDIGTVVVPDAGLKIYMDATAEERAHRRHRELVARGKAVAYEQVLSDILRRDAFDSQRALAPLRAAEDALVVDTTQLTPEQVVAVILGAVQQKEEALPHVDA